MMLSSLQRTLPEIALQIILCQLQNYYCRKEQFQSQNIPIRSIATAVRVTQILE
jgi:hypothetical protein